MSELSLNFIKYVLKSRFSRGSALADVPAEMQNQLQAIFPEISFRFAHTHGFNLLQPAAYDIVILSGALQRDDNFFKTMGHVKRVLTDDGLAIITTAGMNTPRSSRAKWRFTATSLEILLEGFHSIYTEAFDEGKTICAHARKKPKQAVNPEETAQKEGALQC